MALNFPTNPSIDQRYPPTGFPAWTWDGVKWLAVSRGGGGDGGIADAPSNGSTYGRANEAWAEVLPITGGTLTGGLEVANGNLKVAHGDLRVTRGDGTGTLFLGDGNQSLSWDGGDYRLSGTVHIWHSGNFNPAGKVNSDGYVSHLYWDGYRVIANINQYGTLALARYTDITDVQNWVNSNFATSNWVNGNFATYGALNNFVQLTRLIYLTDYNVVSSAGSWIEWAGAVITGAYASPGRGAIDTLRYRYLQYYIPNAGWITSGS